MAESSLRIDLVIPGPEGGWISRALRDEGFEVEIREFLKPTGAALYLVALSVPSFEKSVMVLREHEPTSCLVAVGWDPLEDERMRELRIDAFYPQPVPIARLVRKVQTLLASGEQLAPPTEAGKSAPPTTPGSRSKDLDEDRPSSAVIPLPTLSPPADQLSLELDVGAANPDEPFDEDDPPTSQDFELPDRVATEPPVTATRKKSCAPRRIHSFRRRSSPRLAACRRQSCMKSASRCRRSKTRLPQRAFWPAGAMPLPPAPRCPLPAIWRAASSARSSICAPSPVRSPVPASRYRLNAAFRRRWSSFATAPSRRAWPSKFSQRHRQP